MFNSLAKYAIAHRSAILGTLVVMQNTHAVKGVGGSVISAMISLLGG